jgi:archaellum biogenesis protein FlaJ (TadC family)
LVRWRGLGRRGGVNLGIFDAIGELFLDTFPGVREAIERSGMDTPSHDYIVRGLRISIIAFLTVYILSQLTFIPYFVYFPGVEILYRFVIFAPLSLLVFAVCLGVFLAYPYVRIAIASSKISAELLNIMTYLYSLSGSGATFDEIMKFMAESFDKDVASPFIRYYYYRSVLGWDVNRALNRAAERCPNLKLAEVLFTLSQTIITTENITPTVETLYNKILNDKRIELESKIDSLSLLSEIYIAAMVVFPVLAITILIIISMVGGTLLGMDPPLLTSFVVYLMIPLSIAFVVLLSAGE